jgi:hypothetical protein
VLAAWPVVIRTELTDMMKTTLTSILFLSACSWNTKPGTDKTLQPKMVINHTVVWANLDSLEVFQILKIPTIAAEPAIIRIKSKSTSAENKGQYPDTIQVLSNHQLDSSLDAFGKEYFLIKDKNTKWVIVDSTQWLE